MTLKKYLEHMRLSQSEFSAMCQINPKAMQKYVNGDRMPIVKNLKTIYAVTLGAVTANDFAGLQPESIDGILRKLEVKSNLGKKLNNKEYEDAIAELYSRQKYEDIKLAEGSVK